MQRESKLGQLQIFATLAKPNKGEQCKNNNFKNLEGLVAQSVISATNMLGDRDARGLSTVTTDPRRNSGLASALCKDVGMLL